MKGSLVRLTIPLVVAMALAACGSSGAAGTGQATRNPNLISQEEISRTAAANAQELVERLRPQWLRQGAIGGLTTASGEGGMYGGASTVRYLLVYLDNVKMGTTETLRSVSASSVTSIRLLSAERAAATLPDIGRDPIQGAIVISTR